MLDSPDSEKFSSSILPEPSLAQCEVIFFHAVCSNILGHWRVPGHMDIVPIKEALVIKCLYTEKETLL